MLLSGCNVSDEACGSLLVVSAVTVSPAAVSRLADTLEDIEESSSSLKVILVAASLELALTPLSLSATPVSLLKLTLLVLLPPLLSSPAPVVS